MTVNKLTTQQQQVQMILENSTAARNSDLILFAEYLKQYKPELCDLPLVHVLEHSRLYGLPSYESITRCRRKAQQERPELAGEKAKAKRREQEVIYRQYAAI